MSPGTSRSDGRAGRPSGRSAGRQLRLPFRARRRQLVRSFRHTADAILSPLPTVEVRSGRWLPAWLLRVGCGLLGAGVMALLGLGGPAIGLLSAFVLAVLVRPSARTGGAFCLITAFVWTVLPSNPVSWRAVGILALTPAVLALATTIEAVPLTSRIEWRAIWPSLRRFLVVQLVSQPVVIVLAGLHRLPEPVPLALPIAIAGAAVVAVAAWLLLPRLNR